MSEDIRSELKPLQLVVSRDNYPELDEIIDKLGGEILIAMSKRKMGCDDLPLPYQRIMDAIDQWEKEVKGREG
jgi:hypothetical protein